MALSLGYYLAHSEESKNTEAADTWLLSAEAPLVQGASGSFFCWSPWEWLLLSVFEGGGGILVLWSVWGKKGKGKLIGLH